MTSTANFVHRVSYVSGENLNGQLYRLVKLNTSGQVILSSAAGDYSIGVVAMDPQRSKLDTTTTIGDIVPIALLMGIVPMITGAGGITAGDLVVADANGGVVSAGADFAAATDEDYVIGVALSTTAAGEVASIHCQPVHVTAGA
jgi:hypothetical protein